MLDSFCSGKNEGDGEVGKLDLTLVTFTWSRDRRY